jgi:GntR family transcriptional repressor for pyruvate dehydrogenase complex
MLKAVVKKRAYEDIVKQIRALIKKGKLKQGDRLPNERELSETFKVSRATVREAVLSLETMKLVDRRQGHGTYVIASSEEALVQPLAPSFFHEKDDLIDIFFLRKIIEPEVARLASENGTPQKVNELGKILRQQEKVVAGDGNPIKTDTKFHHLLAQMAKNKVLERLLLALFDKTRETHLQSEERKEKSLQGHYDVFAAVKSGNGRAGRQAMRRHLEDVESILFQKKKGNRKAV